MYQFHLHFPRFPVFPSLNGARKLPREILELGKYIKASLSLNSLLIAPSCLPSLLPCPVISPPSFPYSIHPPLLFPHRLSLPLSNRFNGRQYPSRYLQWLSADPPPSNSSLHPQSLPYPSYQAATSSLALCCLPAMTPLTLALRLCHRRLIPPGSLLPFITRHPNAPFSPLYGPCSSSSLSSSHIQ